jgi:hypothetical protein
VQGNPVAEGLAGAFTVAVDSRAPVADAGADAEIVGEDDDWRGRVTLDGSASADPDGPADIVSYIWERAGLVVGSGARPTVDLPLGTHTLLLTVTDATGLTGRDSVTIAVRSAPGSPPFTLALADKVAQIPPGYPRVRVDWTGELPGSTLDLWSLGPAGWQSVAANLDAYGGLFLWDPSLLYSGWYRLAGHAVRGAGAVEFVPGRHVRVAPSPLPPAPRASPAAADAGLPVGTALPAIQLLTPSQSRVIFSGSSFEIRWEILLPSQAPESLTLRARPTGESDWRTIVSSIPTGQGHYRWDTSSLAPGSYLITALWQSEGVWQEAAAPYPLDIQLS